MSTLAADTSPPAQAGAWEREIEARVYRRYGLTPEEVALVEEGGQR